MDSSKYELGLFSSNDYLCYYFGGDDNIFIHFYEGLFTLEKFGLYTLLEPMLYRELYDIMMDF
jgi:hypothetical protein